MPPNLHHASEEPVENVSSGDSNIQLMGRLKGTVIRKIWGQILFVIAYTTTVVLVHNYVDGWQMNFPQTLIPVLGVVTGLLLVFRTNTAYDRYWEGRKIWSHMTLNIRTLTRSIWTGVAERPDNAQDIIEKLSIINLLVAFPFAVKNYLRGDYSYDDTDDLKELISHLPRFATPSSLQSFTSQQDPRKSVDLSSSSSAKITLPNDKKFKPGNFLAHDFPTPTNIPIELSYYFASYLSLPSTKEAMGPMMSTMNSALNALVECLTGFERILRTPIPLAYSVHLHHSLWIYLLALPYQIVGVLNWWTIPAVTLASFALLGILAIGKEIENPFGTDYNDLPLDDFCKVIQREIYVMVGRTMPKPESWMTSLNNHPITPTTFLTAEQLSQMSVDAIRVLLTQRAQISEPPPPPVTKESVSKFDKDGGLRSVATALMKSKRYGEAEDRKTKGDQPERDAMIKIKSEK